MKKMPRSFFKEQDVLAMAHKLLGKLLITEHKEGRTAGRIIEVEAYGGTTDKASHAYGGRRTRRTEIMYKEGGCAYIYLCYGIHHLFNVVSGRAGSADAVLIRALRPVLGIDLMRRRRGLDEVGRLCGGPGTLTQSLGLDSRSSGCSLEGPIVWLADDGHRCLRQDVRATARIGIDYAEEDRLRPWRLLYEAPSGHCRSVNSA